jgi:hypothetical protein
MAPRNAQTHFPEGRSSVEAGNWGPARCGACRREFARTRPWQLFCSEPCRKLGWKRDRISPRVLAEIFDRLGAIESKLEIKKGE